MSSVENMESVIANKVDMDSHTAIMDGKSEKSTIIPELEWNFLSQNEVKALAFGHISNGKLDTLEELRFQNRLAYYLFGPVALASLIVSTIFQFKDGGTFGTLLMTVFQPVVIFEFYELGRHSCLKMLSRADPSKVKQEAEYAHLRNVEYINKMKQKLDLHNINETSDLDKNGTKLSIVSKEPDSEPGNVLYGYKRVYFVLLVISVLACLGSINPK
jgi:hypothetical protein